MKHSKRLSPQLQSLPIGSWTLELRPRLMPLTMNLLLSFQSQLLMARCTQLHSTPGPFPLQNSTTMYCINPALDRYLSHLGRTPCTQTMISLNICSMVLYNTWHPCSHASLFASVHLVCLHPSDLLLPELTTHRPHHQLISTKPS